jgi:hypothetical protein
MKFNFDLVNKWYKCPICKNDLPYGTSPCPGCKSELGWIGQTDIPYLIRSFTIEVKGESYTNDDGTQRQDIIRHCKIGEPIKLVHEPHPKDKNAVKVCRLNGEQLGYIPKYASAEFAEIIKRGIKQDVKIAEIKDGEYTGCWLKITRYNGDLNNSTPVNNNLEHTVKTDTLIFYVEKIQRQELAKCRIGDYINFWVPKDNSHEVHIFRRGSVGGMGRIGLVPSKYSAIISAHLSKGLEYETEIMEVNIDKSCYKIRCKLISQEETAAKQAAEQEVAARRLRAELQKRYKPKDSLLIRVQLLKNHKLNEGQELFLEKQPLEYYIQNAQRLHINLVDKDGIVVAQKTNEPKLIRSVLRAFFSQYAMNFQIISIETPDKYTLNYLDRIEAKVKVSLETDT